MNIHKTQLENLFGNTYKWKGIIHFKDNPHLTWYLVIHHLI